MTTYANAAEGSDSSCYVDRSLAASNMPDSSSEEATSGSSVDTVRDIKLSSQTLTASHSTAAVHISRTPVACAGGAQVHRLLLLCTKRHTSWIAFGDDYWCVTLCSTAGHLASPSKMSTEHRRVCSRQGDWHPSVCVEFSGCSSTTVLDGNLCLWCLQFRNGKQHLVRISLLSSARLPAKQQVGSTSQSWLNWARLLPLCFRCRL